MKLVVIDGQSGRTGALLVERIRAAGLPLELLAVGTNAIATAAMMKAGAQRGATGENPGPEGTAAGEFQLRQDRGRRP